MTTYVDLEVMDWFQDPQIAKLPRWRQHAALRFGLATTYSENDGFLTWRPDQLEDLWLRLCTTPGPIVGWNIDEFDLPYLAVQAIRRGYTYDPWRELPDSLDLMGLIRSESKRLEGKERWYKLEIIAIANVGRGKISHGDEAAAWLRSGDPELAQKAADYCRDDVQLVMELHQRLLEGKPLICPPRPDRREYSELKIYLPQQ